MYLQSSSLQTPLSSNGHSIALTSTRLLFGPVASVSPACPSAAVANDVFKGWEIGAPSLAQEIPAPPFRFWL